MPLDPQAKSVLDLLNAAPPIDIATLQAPQMREHFDKLALPQEVPEVAKVEDRSIPGPAGEIPVRIYTPEGAGPRPGLVYFHGGGFVIGSIETHDGTCRDLANSGRCSVISVDYRLAPEAPYPAAPEDCFAATCWVAEHGAELDIDPLRIAVGGDSAGGNLAAVVALMCRDRGGPSLRHQLLVYPVTDHAFDTSSYQRNGDDYMLTRDMMQWFWRNYLERPELGNDALASPLRAPDLSGLPSATVITAEFDPLLDEGEAYASRLREAGVDVQLSRYDGVFHGFFGMGAIIDRAIDAVEEAGAALRRALAH